MSPVEIQAGDSSPLVVPILDATGQPANIDGWTALVQVRRTDRDPILASWSTAAGTATCAGSTVTLAMDGTQTASWSWRCALLQVAVTDPGGRPHVLPAQEVRLLPLIAHTP